MAWVQSYIDNEQVFPSRIGAIHSPVLRILFRCLLDLRRPFPKKLPNNRAPTCEASLPCLCPHLLPSLPCDCSSRSRSAYEYLLQTLRSLHQGVQPRVGQRLLRSSIRHGGYDIEGGYLMFFSIVFLCKVSPLMHRERDGGGGVIMLCHGGMWREGFHGVCFLRVDWQVPVLNSFE